MPVVLLKRDPETGTQRGKCHVKTDTRREGHTTEAETGVLQELERGADTSGLQNSERLNLCYGMQFVVQQR